jgi:hypothetical protein
MRGEPRIEQWDAAAHESFFLPVSYMKGVVDISKKSRDRVFFFDFSNPECIDSSIVNKIF